MSAAAIWHAHFDHGLGDLSDQELIREADSLVAEKSRGPVLAAIRQEQARRRYRAVWGTARWDWARPPIVEPPVFASNYQRAGAAVRVARQQEAEICATQR